MSYWIYLDDEKGDIIDTDTVREEGATYVIGGISEAELNITYNYAKYFDFRKLDGMKAAEAKNILDNKINQLGDDINSDYWKPTEGNVKKTLIILSEFCKFAIDNKIENARFRVS